MTSTNNNTCFPDGSRWLRADFHLHTRADKEFTYNGEDDAFVRSYIDALKKAEIGIGVITNHNKFDVNEFKALRKRARKESVLLLPGVELSVNDGANGVHMLVVFSDEWIADGKDYINQFIGAVFAGKVPEEYEQENGRCNLNITESLKKLEEFHKPFFVVFAHAEEKSGLWNELKGGRMEELGKNPLFRRYTLGFQKVRSFNKFEQDKPCRTKVQQWLKDWYPAEVEGCDAKALDQIGRGRCSYLKIGAMTFDAVRYALADHQYRVTTEVPVIEHSYIRAIRFEGGLLDGHRLAFSTGLNCLIGIRGSGKSSLLEAVRYALNLPFGQKAQDTHYKEGLIPHLLGSGGKVIVEATDRHGRQYEVHRILNELPDVYVDGKLQPGVSIDDTIIRKPLYFGQKDLSATGEGFETDLVEKLVARQLGDVRSRIEAQKQRVLQKINQLQALSNAEEKRKEYEDRLKDTEFKLNIFHEHKVEEKLKEQVEFDRDIRKSEQTQSQVDAWLDALEDLLSQHEDDLRNAARYQSHINQEFFQAYFQQYQGILNGLETIKKALEQGRTTRKQLAQKHQALLDRKAALKETFAQTERELAQVIEQQGLTSIQPQDYLNLSKDKQRYQQLLEAARKQSEKEDLSRSTLLESLAELNELWREEFRLIQDELNNINQDQTALSIEVEFKGDKDKTREYLKQVFRGSRLRETYFEQLCEDYADFGAMYRELDTIAAAEPSGEKFRGYFLENLKDLLTWQVPNRFVVNYHGKPLQEHSLGQRASAMMLFILSRQNNDLIIIDQPEDDLDNQTIYEDVIKLIRRIKTKVQFIFATHNANFPVLGDAEQVIACRFQPDAIETQAGSIDCPNIQQAIVNIMEGGEEAFNKRKEIYHLWKP